MDEIEKAAEDHVRSLYGEYYKFSKLDTIQFESFKAGALYWKERSDREIADLKAEIERLKALPHKPTNSQPNNQGE